MPKKETEKMIPSVLNVVGTVKCTTCGKMHSLDSAEFVVFYGDVTVGTSSKVISGNIEKNRLTGSTVYCREPGCLKDVLEQFGVQDVRKRGKEVLTD